MMCSSTGGDGVGAIIKRLGEVAEIVPGAGDDRRREGKYQYFYYQPNNLSDACSVLPTIFRNEPVSEKQLVRNGDIIIKRLNHDRTHVVTKVEKPSTISQNLFIVRIDETKCLPEYLAFLFEQQEVILQTSQMSGSAAPIRALSVKMLADISIPIIALEKQQALGSVWRLAKRRQSLLRKLEAENNRLMTAVYNNTLGTR